jgi:hypothetical protein
VITSNDARGILAGIVQLACRLTGANPKDYRIKIGGDQVGDRAEIDWYATVQNVTALVNTAKAKDVGLIRRSFGIRQKRPEDDIFLLIREWAAGRDWQQDYRCVWEKPASNMKARKEMAELLAESIRTLR